MLGLSSSKTDIACWCSCSQDCSSRSDLIWSSKIGTEVVHLVAGTCIGLLVTWIQGKTPIWPNLQKYASASLVTSWARNLDILPGHLSGHSGLCSFSLPACSLPATSHGIRSSKELRQMLLPNLLPCHLCHSHLHLLLLPSLACNHGTNKRCLRTTHPRAGQWEAEVPPFVNNHGECWEAMLFLLLSVMVLWVCGFLSFFHALKSEWSPRKRDCRQKARISPRKPKMEPRSFAESLVLQQGSGAHLCRPCFFEGSPLRVERTWKAENKYSLGGGLPW